MTALAYRLQTLSTQLFGLRGLYVIALLSHFRIIMLYIGG